jgi:hypothetical protein
LFQTTFDDTSILSKNGQTEFAILTCKIAALTLDKKRWLQVDAPLIILEIDNEGDCLESWWPRG